MEESNEKDYKFFKIILLLAQSFTIGVCVLFFIGVTKVDALEERSNNDATGFVNSWTTITTEDTITNYNVVYNTTNRTWEQFKDTAMVGTNKYNLEFTLKVQYFHNRNNDITGNLYLTLYNGTTLVNMGQKCSKSVTKQEAILFTYYVYDVSCVGFSGNGYYPYINVQVQASNAQTGSKVVSNMTKWNYYISSASVDTDSINQNNNNNTETIINNNNTNTETIINNQNENTEKEIESQQICNTITKQDNKYQESYLKTNGTIAYDSATGVTDYITIDKNTEIKVIRVQTGGQYNVCYYDEDKNPINCQSTGTMTENTILTIPSNANYVRFTIHNTSNKPTFQICKNGNQALNDALTDSNIDSSKINGFNVVGSDGGITSIITSPLSAIQGILNNTCSDITVPIPFTNKNFLLPCLTPIYNQYFPTILNIWQVVVTGIISYWICLNIFHMVHGFTDPTDDKIEVVDL